ncbi:MAG: hypothetical protein MI746_16350 [Pseudomonadales bacterium]|nr:hypothetical protein [Pseudomonadales bacterium]
MHPMLNIALRAARDAAEALAHKTERLDRVAVIDSSPESFLTSADQESDKTLIYHIQKAFPKHSIHSRVSGVHEGDADEPIWLIDPLVGSLNFAKGYARFGVAIAIRNKGNIEHGLVINPMQHDEFSASRGAGAQLNSRRIRVGSEELESSLIGLDSTNSGDQNFIELQSTLLKAGAIPRIGGCSTLDVVDTACDRLQGGWCRRTDDVSIAAANLVLLEAGGLLGTESGNPKLDSGEEQLFGTAKIFKQLVKIRMRSAQ